MVGIQWQDFSDPGKNLILNPQYKLVHQILRLTETDHLCLAIKSKISANLDQEQDSIIQNLSKLLWQDFHKDQIF